MSYGLALAASIIAGIQLGHLVTWSSSRIAAHGIFFDDAYFYSVLARNFSRFGLFTMDGQMATNGFHPLWMWLQVGLVKLFPGVDTVRLLALSSWFMYLVFSFCIVRFMTRRGRWRDVCAAVIVCATVLLNVRFQAYAVQGVETPLCLTLFTLLLAQIARYSLGGGGDRPVPTIQTVVLAGLASLCFLVRTDLFWIPILVGAWRLVGRRASRREWMVCGGVMTLLTLPYLIHNLSTQGELMPVSGRAKIFYRETFFPTVSSYLQSEDWRGMIHAFTDPFPLLARRAWIAVGATCVLFFGALALTFLRRSTESPASALRLTGSALLLHVAYLHLFYGELRPVTAYYFAPELIWTAVVLSTSVPSDNVPARRSARKQRALRWSLHVAALPVLGLAAFILMVAQWYQRDLSPQAYWQQRLRLAEDIDRLLPPDAAVGAFWPGLFAQFSNRPITPLDGVVGSHQFFEQYVKTGRELEYMLGRFPASYLAVYLPSAPDHFLSQPRININYWSRIGILRMWQKRQAVDFRPVSARPIQPDGEGWYLLEMRARGSAR